MTKKIKPPSIDHAVDKWAALRDYIKHEIEAWENHYSDPRVVGGNIGALRRTLEHMDKLDKGETE